jgi:tetratricopeptide (TPR) repeat protein
MKGAKKYYDKSEEICRCENDKLKLANVLISKGDLESQFGNIDEAMKHYEEAKKLYCELNDKRGEDNVSKNMSDLQDKFELCTK